MRRSPSCHSRATGLKAAAPTARFPNDSGDFSAALTGVWKLASEASPHLYVGKNAEAIARMRLRKEIYTGEGIPEHPQECRRPGAVEAFIELLTAVRAAGSWKRYAAEPRVQLVVLRKLAESGRAVATRGVLTRLFAPRRRLQSIGSPLPDVLFWKVLEFWRTDRDPPSC